MKSANMAEAIVRPTGNGVHWLPWLPRHQAEARSWANSPVGRISACAGCAELTGYLSAHLPLDLFDLSLCFFKGPQGWEDKGLRIPDTKELLFVFPIGLNTLHSPSRHQPIDSKHGSEIIPF